MILLYHNVVPADAPPGYACTALALPVADFRRHMIWLARHFTMVSLADHVTAWRRSPRATKGMVSVTFDDGSATTFRCVRPILEETRVPATVFVTTCHLEHGPLIWGAYLNALCFENAYSVLNIDARRYELATPAQRLAARRNLAGLAHASGDPARFATDLARAYPLPEAIRPYYEGMTSTQLRAAGASDLIEIGAHAVTHRDLSSLPRDVQAWEIRESRRVLAELCGTSVRYFAYPSGDYDDRTLAVVSEMGFEAAFATASRRLGAQPHLEINRVGVYSRSLLKLLAKTAGLTGLARRLGLPSG